MCLILDANRAGKFFAPSPGPDDACVWAWLERGGKLVFGGQYNRAAHAHLLAHTDGCPGNCAKSSRRHK